MRNYEIVPPLFIPHYSLFTTHYSLGKASLLETAGRFFIAFYPLLFFLMSQKTS